MYFYDSVPTPNGFRVTVVTKTELITGYVADKSPWQRVVDRFRAGHEPLAVLANANAVERAAHRLSDLQSLEYHTNNTELKTRFVDRRTQKLTCVDTTHTSIHVRDRAVAEIKAACGVDFEESVRRASLWHVGGGQFIVAAIALLTFCGIGIAAQFDAFDPQAEINAPIRRGRQGEGLTKLLAHLCLLVGADGMVAIGLGIAGAAYVWFFKNWVKSPQRFTLTALGRPPEKASPSPLNAPPPDALGYVRCPRCSKAVVVKEVVDGSCPKCSWPVAPYSSQPQLVVLSPFRVRNAQHKYWILLPLLFLCPLIIMLQSKFQPEPGVDNRVAGVVIFVVWGAGVAGAMLYGAFRVPPRRMVFTDDQD